MILDARGHPISLGAGFGQDGIEVEAGGIDAMAQFVEVCGVEEVAEGRALAVEVDGLRIAIFRDGGNFHALLGRCPHANGAMGNGWVEDGEAVCPLHRWRFKLASGRCTTMPGHSLHRFRSEVREGRVWVEA